MFTIKRLFCGYLLTTAMLGALPPFLWTIAAAQPAIAQPQFSWKNLIDTILGRSEPRDPGPVRRGGSRGDPCWLAPTEAVWNNRPLLIWTGSFRSVGIRSAGSDNILWRSMAPANRKCPHQPETRIHQLQYTGKALEPGKSYEWVFFLNETSNLPMLRVPLRVIDADAHAAIAKDLQALDAKLKAENANQNAIALQRANFFVQRGLRTDALQAMYALKIPSAELKQARQEIQKTLCQSQK